jgi:hypothetical protein
VDINDICNRRDGERKKEEAPYISASIVKKIMIATMFD